METKLLTTSAEDAVQVIDIGRQPVIRTDPGY